MTTKILAAVSCCALLLLSMLTWDLAPTISTEFNISIKAVDCIAAFLFLCAFIPSVYFVDEEEDKIDNSK